MIAIVPDQINCDYYEFNKGRKDALNSYNGEYMSQYEWSDVTAAYLERNY